MVKSKSAYSTPTKKGKLDTHIFVVWVDNEAGVLARVVGLFSGRGYNFESLAVAEIDKKQNLSRIPLVTSRLAIPKPSQPLFTSPYWIKSLTIERTVIEGIESPTPSDPPEVLLINVFIPISLPSVSIRAPPELPLFIEA